MKIKETIFFISLIEVGILVMILFSCGRPSEGSRKAGEHIAATVTPVVETFPVPEKKNEDSADDPAIWVNSEYPEKSIIIGTDKKGGIVTYNLSGEELHYYFAGNMNNCDLRYGFTINGDTVDILAASNRSHHSISLFKIHQNGVLDTLHSRIIQSEMADEVYGLAMYKSRATGKFYVFVNSKSGEVEQWELFSDHKRVDARLVRSFSLGAQTEGMVADDETGILYISKEEAGIWKFDAEPEDASGTFIENSSEENSNIRYDIEGLAIYNTGSGNGYLLASSQGNYSYAVFERQGNNKYLGSFRVISGEIDGVEETDGIEITSTYLGAKFPKGILVVQDGFNYDGHKKKSQNFKIISWEEIEKIIRSF